MGLLCPRASTRARFPAPRAVEGQDNTCGAYAVHGQKANETTSDGSRTYFDVTEFRLDTERPPELPSPQPGRTGGFVEEHGMVAPDAFGPSQKWWGILPAFDPDGGNVVAEPPGAGYGFWAGAPSAVYGTGSSLVY